MRPVDAPPAKRAAIGALDLAAADAQATTRYSAEDRRPGGRSARARPSTAPWGTPSAREISAAQTVQGGTVVDKPDALATLIVVGDTTRDIDAARAIAEQSPFLEMDNASTQVSELIVMG